MSYVKENEYPYKANNSDREIIASLLTEGFG